MQTNERNESNANTENNDNDNAFYLAVSHHGTAMIAKQARETGINPRSRREQLQSVMDIDDQQIYHSSNKCELGVEYDHEHCCHIGDPDYSI